ncbi:sigma-70 family RNA polymerase sigma factor (plasmid) [Streptomyces sp. BI20]|uniref:sigma-70 family RNA polymerase sigma factor n=1 Tax=Streptomyces sp. BI20 TaxID=3403460 RepID=UPI003C70C205
MTETPPETAAQRTARFERDALCLRPVLYIQAMRLSRHPADAEDLVQETFTKAFRHFESFRPGTNMRAWLGRILLNTYLTTYRRRQHEPQHTSLSDVEDWQYANVASHTARGLPSAEDQVLRAIPDPEVDAALRAIPPEFRDVVLLADVEGLPYAEIAGLIGIPHGTVNSRLHRGRRRLRTLLDGHHARPTAGPRNRPTTT